MKNKINLKKADNVLDNLSANKISVTRFADMLVQSRRIFSITIEKIYTQIKEEQEKKYEKIEMKKNDHTDHKYSNRELRYNDNNSDFGEKKNKKIYYSQNFNLVILERGHEI
jgi:hypothetical protein